MAAAAGGANFVRFFFYRKNTIRAEQKSALVALAYATARDQKLAPKSILIRSDVHKTTIIDGKCVEDPKGWHGTFAFKDDDQVDPDYHVTSHGYTDGKESFILKEACHTLEKSDDTRRGSKKDNKVIWPADPDKLEEYVDSPIAYSRLPEHE